MKDVMCEGKDVCQARGITDLFMGSSGCVDINGESISSCSSGDLSGTSYLRCGDDCFIGCNGGLAGKDVGTEIFKGHISAKECKELCKVAEGCIAYKHTLRQCTIKYNPQEAQSEDTCKGESWVFMTIVKRNLNIIIQRTAQQRTG